MVQAAVICAERWEPLHKHGYTTAVEGDGVTGAQGLGANAAQLEQPSPSPQTTSCGLWGQRWGLPMLMK